ncbi:MAG: hypothetical protein CSH49_14720 [Alcanivorax sp.]|nr:MAG: hypothetical protein CSH49_14720 [Alcanivorax sp.]
MGLGAGSLRLAAVSKPAAGLCVMMGAVMLNLLLAALIGITVPMLLVRLKKDPAMGSSVVLTFATDSMGFFLFLGLATLILV